MILILRENKIIHYLTNIDINIYTKCEKNEAIAQNAEKIICFIVKQKK